jgi:hypothetical protein
MTVPDGMKQARCPLSMAREDQAVASAQRSFARVSPEPPSHAETNSARARSASGAAPQPPAAERPSQSQASALPPVQPRSSAGADRL